MPTLHQLRLRRQQLRERYNALAVRRREIVAATDNLADELLSVVRQIVALESPSKSPSMKGPIVKKSTKPSKSSSKSTAAKGAAKSTKAKAPGKPRKAK